MNIKIIFRSGLAIVIVLISLMLLWTCVVKIKEILDAPSAQATTFQLKSDAQQQYRLVSHRDRPDQKIFITLPNQTSVMTIPCTHYLNNICTIQDDQQFFRVIQQIELQNFKNHIYIKNVSFTHSQTLNTRSIQYTDQQIHDFYLADIENLKYQVFSLILFTLFALYASFRILRNFKQFLHK